MAHYTDYNSFSEAFIGFSNLCRSHKLKIGIHQSSEAMIAAVKGLWQDEDLFRYSLKAIYTTSPEEGEIINNLYTSFWLRNSTLVKSKTTYKNQSNITKPSEGSLVMMGVGDQDDLDETEAKNMVGANTKETLRKTDFAKIEEMDSALLNKLAEELWHQMTLRLKRQRKMGKKGKVHIQSTIRKNISNGGSMLHLLRQRKKTQKYKLVILLDVSGSMDKYSFYLLKFIYTLRSNFENLEAFIFSTRLVRISEYLDRKNLKETLALLSYNANNWSSGTKIGYCLNIFNTQYARKILNGKTLTILLSDGLDTGAPDLLKQELKKIKLRTKKLVWLNPLKGMSGYEPIQRGMAAALPELDVFQSAHSLDSLLALEKILMDV